MNRSELLDAHGFVVVPDALDSGEVARLTMAFDAAAATATGTQHVDVDDATPHADAWRRLADHPVVVELTIPLLGTAGYRLHGRNPLPGYGRQGLHADAPPRRPGDPVAAVTAIWMLDDFTTKNGATRVVPGTHVRHDAVPRSLAQPDAHHPDEILVTGAAGSVVVFNGHLWHSGTRNRSDGPRRAVQMTATR